MSHDSLLDQETRVKAIEDLWKISRRLESPGPVFTDTSADGALRYQALWTFSPCSGTSIQISSNRSGPSKTAAKRAAAAEVLAEASILEA